jgi:hypothetical protein
MVNSAGDAEPPLGRRELAHRLEFWVDRPRPVTLPQCQNMS